MYSKDSGANACTWEWIAWSELEVGPRVVGAGRTADVAVDELDIDNGSMFVVGGEEIVRVVAGRGIADHQASRRCGGDSAPFVVRDVISLHTGIPAGHADAVPVVVVTEVVYDVVVILYPDAAGIVSLGDAVAYDIHRHCFDTVGPIERGNTIENDAIVAGVDSDGAVVLRLALLDQPFVVHHDSIYPVS